MMILIRFFFCDHLGTRMRTNIISSLVSMVIHLIDLLKKYNIS